MNIGATFQPLNDHDFSGTQFCLAATVPAMKEHFITHEDASYLDIEDSVFERSSIVDSTVSPMQESARSVVTHEQPGEDENDFI